MHCGVIKLWRQKLWVELLTVTQIVWTRFFSVHTLNIPYQIEMVLAQLWYGLLLLSHKNHQHYHISYYLIFSLLGLPYIPAATDQMFLTSSCSTQLASFYKRIGWYTMTYPNPTSHQGYVEALSHMTASLRLPKSYWLFFAALLLWVCENAQLILCSLALYHIFCTTPVWSYAPLGSSWGDTMAQKLCCHVNMHMTSLDDKANVKNAKSLVWASLPQQPQEVSASLFSWVRCCWTK